MKLVELYETKDPDGTYAGVTPSEKTKQAIVDWVKSNKIPNPVPKDKLHVTLLYSRKFLPKFKAKGQYDNMMVGKPTKFDVWESSGESPSRCLVLQFKCPELTERHNDLMDTHEAVYDFDEYKPHITISYDIGDMEADSLPKPDIDIELETEYQEDLDLSWAKTHGK